VREVPKVDDSIGFPRLGNGPKLGAVVDGTIPSQRSRSRSKSLLAKTRRYVVRREASCWYLTFLGVLAHRKFVTLVNASKTMEEG
jgi:hypothetical protein